MFDAFHQTARMIFEAAQPSGRLHRNLPSDQLKAMALDEPEVKKTKYGSIFADSEPMSRAARFTKNNIDSRFGEAERDLLEKAQRALGQRRDRLDRRGGRRRHRGDNRPAHRSAAVRPRGLCRPEAASSRP